MLEYLSTPVECSSLSGLNTVETLPRSGLKELTGAQDGVVTEANVICIEASTYPSTLSEWVGFILSEEISILVLPLHRSGVHNETSTNPE